MALLYRVAVLLWDGAFWCRMPLQYHTITNMFASQHACMLIVLCSERAKVIEEELQTIAHFVASQHAGRYRKDKNMWVFCQCIQRGRCLPRTVSLFESTAACGQITV
jgi:hypothetical protein